MVDETDLITVGHDNTIVEEVVTGDITEEKLYGVRENEEDVDAAETE